MNSFTLVVVLAVAAMSSAVAVEIPEADVMLKAEIENYGVTQGLTPVELPESCGGYAMALGDESTGASGGVKLEPGEYTLLVRAWAPAGDQTRMGSLWISTASASAGSHRGDDGRQWHITSTLIKKKRLALQ